MKRLIVFLGVLILISLIIYWLLYYKYLKEKNIFEEIKLPEPLYEP